MDLHDPAILPLGKKPLVPIRQEAGKAPEVAWMLWRREKLFPLQGIESQ
jgi:hypothetical protein